MPRIVAHTLRYSGGPVPSVLEVQPYSDCCYEEYKPIYNECFREMREALGVYPLECCPGREELLQRQELFLLIRDNTLAGGVWLNGHEIDDLIVAKPFQGRGYGRQLLLFAISRMQKKEISPILLHVADWNKKALGLYKQNGFSVIKTEIIETEKEPSL